MTCKPYLSGAAAILALSLGLAVAAPAMAAPVNGTFPIGGNVDLLCGGDFTTPTITISANLADANGFVDETAFVGKTSSTGTVFCNGVNSTAAVSHVNLTNNAVTGSLATGFTKVIAFSPKVTGGSVTITGDTATPTTIGLFDGTMTISLQTGGAANTNVRPVAGSYTGSVAVTLTPAS